MRLFVALEIPGSVREALRDLIARLQPKCDSAKWVRAESMHLTLKFIGHLEPERLPAIREVLAALHTAKPVDAEFHGMGFFPNEKRPRVLWAGVEASPNLAELAAEIEQALVALGIPAETRAFAPHLTVARFHSHDPYQRGKTPEGLAEIIRDATEAKQRRFGSLRAEQFHLFESKLKPSGAEYTRIETFPFVKP
jgi:2'-5' RNA ligase